MAALAETAGGGGRFDGGGDFLLMGGDLVALAAMGGLRLTGGGLLAVAVAASAYWRLRAAAAPARVHTVAGLASYDIAAGACRGAHCV